MRTGPTVLEERATKRRKQSQKNISEEDEDEGEFSEHVSAEDSNFSSDGRMGYEQMNNSQSNTIFTVPIIYNVPSQKENYSSFSSELHDGTSVMKVSHLVNPTPFITHQPITSYQTLFSQFTPDQVNQTEKYRLDLLAKNQNQINEPLKE